MDLKTQIKKFIEVKDVDSIYNLITIENAILASNEKKEQEKIDQLKTFLKTLDRFKDMSDSELEKIISNGNISA